MTTKVRAMAITTLLGVAVSTAVLAGKSDHELVRDARGTLAGFEKTDPGLTAFMRSSSGYAVFPSITKAGVGVGGARGSGVVFDHTGTPVAKVTMTQGSIGLQLGVQGFSEIVFFETPKAFGDFKKGDLSFTANASAVALTAGASKSARYKQGVAVFTATNQGLMFEASVGGQNFHVEPLKAP
jgi:lipid-binding SYLF domain-containing protein